MSRACGACMVRPRDECQNWTTVHGAWVICEIVRLSRTLADFAQKSTAASHMTDLRLESHHGVPFQNRGHHQACLQGALSTPEEHILHRAKKLPKYVVCATVRSCPLDSNRQVSACFGSHVLRPICDVRFWSTLRSPLSGCPPVTSKPS